MRCIINFKWQQKVESVQYGNGIVNVGSEIQSSVRHHNLLQDLLELTLIVNESCGVRLLFFNSLEYF